MAFRINAISVGAVEYLLKGCGCDPQKERVLDLEKAGGPALADHQHTHGPVREHGLEQAGADEYFARAVANGEPRGVWFGEGMAALGLGARAGEFAEDDDVRAVFGQLRRPGPIGAEGPSWIGSKPRNYPSTQERFDRLVAAEPGGVAEGQRRKELEVQAASSGRTAVAYYDFTFSPDKSISVYYAALLAAEDLEGAAAVRAAVDGAVRDALTYAEGEIGWSRVGDHGRNADGDRVGEFVQGTGLSAVLFGHSTSREDEPQLHVHGAILNRIGIVGPDGEVRVGALDGRGFRPVKELLEAAFMRAVEDRLVEDRDVVFEDRPDGKSRQIVGSDPDLLDQASTRARQVQERVEELIDAYRDKHGREPDPSVRSRLAEIAVLGTRRAKGEDAGPAVVQAWGQRRIEACLDMLDDVAAAARSAAVAEHPDLARPASEPGHEPGHELGHELGGHVATTRGPVATGPEGVAIGRDVVATVEERVAAAVAAGVADIQAKYSTWTLGNVASAIDRHLPTSRTLGIGAGTERAAYLERLARGAVAPSGPYGVLQLTGHEPVAVPAELLRECDGRPRFRPHADEHYATAAHLAREEAIVARAHASSAPRIDEPAAAALAERLVVAGLSPDQRAAVVGIMRSGRAADVLIGPAGTGKSRTVAALGQEWTAAHGGKVYGVATSEIATRNLAKDRLYALNTTQFLGAVEPDATGAVREQLAAGDLVVVDEAGMSSTDHLDRISAAAAAAGATVLYTGDPEQLGAVEAGGMFDVLADRVDPGARHELDQVHRLRHDWERDASVRLRAGDASVFDDYAAHGRIEHGTFEEMAHLGVRYYVTDRLAGRSAVLVAGTNQTAADLSEQVRNELIGLGRVDATPLAQDRDQKDIGVGDLVQARHNDYQLRVDPGPPGADGTPGPAESVTNRQLYTVIGVGPDRTLYARDEHGAVAHLPEDYVRQHVALGYAGTIHSAQSLTVHSSYELADQNATRESHYVAATRGAELNLTLLVTDREPDAHDPERQAQLARERYGEMLARRGVDRAATTVRGEYDTAAGSLGSVAARIETEGRLAARARHDATLERLVVDGVLPAEELARLRGEDERPDRDRLERALQLAELDGHDPDRLLSEAVEQRELHTADSVGDVLRHRVRRVAGYASPERDRAQSWRDRVARDLEPGRHGEVGHGEVGGFLGALAVEADARQAALGVDAAAAAPPWAVAMLGPVPGPEQADERAEWERAAAAIGAARDVLGVPDDQVSLGEAPSEQRVLAHDLWTRAHAEVTTGLGDGAGRDWRAAADAELYDARETWARTLPDAPAWVADELAAEHRLVREYDAEALRAAVRAHQAEQTEPGGPRALEHAEAADRWRFFSEQRRAEVERLEHAHTARGQWWDEHADLRGADAAAAAELARRGLSLDRGTEQPCPDDLVAPETILDLDEPTVPPTDEPGDAREAARKTTGATGEGRWVWDEFVAQLRAQHGARLDPEHQLADDDLAHARADEIADQRRTTPTNVVDHQAVEHEVVVPEVEEDKAVEHEVVVPEVEEDKAVEHEVVVPEVEEDKAVEHEVVVPDVEQDQAVEHQAVEPDVVEPEETVAEASARLQATVRAERDAREREDARQQAAEQRAANEREHAEQLDALARPADLDVEPDGPQLESGLEREHEPDQLEVHGPEIDDDGLEL